MQHYRIRGASLVIGRADVDRRGGWFIDGDIIKFDSVAETKDDKSPEVERRCFRLGHGGSTLTPVERGSWKS